MFLVGQPQKSKIEESDSRKRALESLSEERAKKRQKRMAEEKAIMEAENAWKYYAKKAKEIIDSMLDTKEFESCDLAKLRFKLGRLHGFQAALSEKDMLVSQLTTESSIAQQHEEIMTSCEVLESAIYNRIEELMAIASTPVVSPAALDQAIAAASANTPKKDCKTPISAQKKTPAEVIGITWGYFNGDIHDWPKFSKKFDEKVIKDSTLTDGQRLTLLSRSCFETARDIVSCAGTDFTTVWAVLNEMYGEAYIIVYHTMQKVMMLKKLQAPTYDGIRYLEANGSKYVSALSTINMTDNFSPFLVVLLAAKLDDDTARAWDRKRLELAELWANAATSDQARLKSKYVPGWSEFKKFLDGECDIHIKQRIRKQLDGPSRVSTGTSPGTSGTNAVQREETAGAAIPAADARPNSHAQNNQEHRPHIPTAQEKRNAPIDLQCTLCEFVHMRYNCEVFKAMTMEQRWSNADSDGLCVRCLRKYHGRAPCANKTNNESCKKCQRQFGKTVYHNSALCNVAYGNIDEQPRSGNSPTSDEWSN